MAIKLQRYPSYSLFVQVKVLFQIFMGTPYLKHGNGFSSLAGHLANPVTVYGREQKE